MAVQSVEELNLDLNQQSNFISFFKNLPEKPETTIRLFDRSNFTTAHGEDAEYIARTFYKNINAIKTIGKTGYTIQSISISKGKLEALIRKLLLVDGFRIEIYENVGVLSKSCQNWKIKLKGSPGNFSDFEDVLYNENCIIQTGCGVMCANYFRKDGSIIVSIAIIDATFNKLQLCKFTDNNTFNNFESAVVQLHPKECILNFNDNDLKSAVKHTGLNIPISEVKKKDFNTKNIEQDLLRLLRNKSDLFIVGLDKEITLSTIAPILNYLDLLHKEECFGSFTLDVLNLNNFMKLDATAIKSLNVFHEEKNSSKNNSVYGIFNVCKTAMGQRLLHQWLIQPLNDLRMIKERQTITSVFVNDTIKLSKVRNLLSMKIMDIPRIICKFNKKKADLEDCYKIYLCVSKISEFISYLNDEENYIGKVEIDINFVEPLTNLRMKLSDFMNLITSSIDEETVSSTGRYLIKADYNAELLEMKKNLNRCESEINNLFNKTAKDLSLSQKNLKLDQDSDSGYFFRVTKKDEKNIRRNKSVIIIGSKNDGVKFVTQNLKSVNDHYLHLMESYIEQQKDLANNIIHETIIYMNNFISFSDVLSKLDVLTSFAEVVVNSEYPYCQPNILERSEGLIEIESLRHLCVEKQPDISYISNSIYMEKNKEMLLVITGPNMGGKSTYIKSVGLAILLAQIGSYIPAESAKISIVDSIQARVGAGDYQMKGVSTFMAEMLETSSILKCATENSLIIIDELGRGTSTYDGFGLAWAIAEHISKNLKSYCLFATHYHELTSLANEVTTVKNYHMEAICENDNLLLLYKLKEGPCNRSYGLDIANMTNFPPDVQKNAKNMLIDLEAYQSEIEICRDSELATKNKNNGEKILQEILSDIRKECLSKDSINDFKMIQKKLKKRILESNNTFLQTIFKD